MTKQFVTGDRITWQYTHHLNSCSRVERVKQGYFIRMRDSIIAKVQFDGNKHPSFVPENELSHES